jgi:hypothetical protein
MRLSKFGANKPMIIGIAVVSILALIGGIYYYMDYKKKNPSPTKSTFSKEGSDNCPLWKFRKDGKCVSYKSLVIKEPPPAIENFTGM